MVSEMSGSYDLLVPLMLVSVINFAILSRRWTLYEEQVPSLVDSPAHLGDFVIDVLEGIKVREVYKPRPARHRRARGHAAAAGAAPGGQLEGILFPGRRPAGQAGGHLLAARHPLRAGGQRRRQPDPGRRHGHRRPCSPSRPTTTCTRPCAATPRRTSTRSRSSTRTTPRRVICMLTPQGSHRRLRPQAGRAAQAGIDLVRRLSRTPCPTPTRSASEDQSASSPRLRFGLVWGRASSSPRRAAPGRRTTVPVNGFCRADFPLDRPPGTCCKSNRQRDLQTEIPLREGVLSPPSPRTTKVRIPAVSSFAAVTCVLSSEARFRLPRPPRRASDGT